MIDPDIAEKVLSSSVNECQAKLCLVADYLERFKIHDARIVAPINDIERCVDMMAHALHKDEPEGDPHV